METPPPLTEFSEPFSTTKLSFKYLKVDRRNELRTLQLPWSVLGQSIIGARGALRGLGPLHATPEWHQGPRGVQDGGSEVQRGLALD